MAYFRIEWLTDEWPTANGILDYAQGAWDRLRSTDPVFRGRNGLLIADELFIQLRTALLDVSRQLQPYLSDELLESTVQYLGCKKSAVT